jgi:hypothetical protein
VKASVRGLIGAVAVALVGVLALSGGDSDDPRTPPAIPGLPPPFLTAAVLGQGGLTAGVDAYGDIVDLRAPGPAGQAMIDNPHARQAAGTVPAATGIVPTVSIDGGPPRRFWEANSVTQAYLPDTDILRTAAHFGDVVAVSVCATDARRLGCLGFPGESDHDTSPDKSGHTVQVRLDSHLSGGARTVHLQDAAAHRIIARAYREDHRWLSGARRLGPGATVWARRLYRRSLLVLHALTGRNGAVAAGARDGWSYVWPRDSGAVALALSAAGYRPEARRVAHFLGNLDLGAAARFLGDGEPVPGRAAQGDASGWARVAARASEPQGRRAEKSTQGSKFGPSADQFGWGERADYQEGATGDYLGNFLACECRVIPPMREELDTSSFETPAGLVREAGDASSGLDSAAAWAVEPFPHPALRAAAARTLQRLAGESGRYGIVPSQRWPDRDPWSAPTAWTAWSLAALGDRHRALRLLGELRRTETPAGLLPERVDRRTGVATSTTPLVWSHAFAILALRRLWPGPNPGGRGCGDLRSSAAC